MFLVDTNVISEARKGLRANPGVQAFWREVNDGEVFISAITIGELRRGVENLKHRTDLIQARRLETWLLLLCNEYANRILNFDWECAHIWGALMAPNPQHVLDKQIAAIALLHDLTVVTRNTADFLACGVKLNNPFSA